MNGLATAKPDEKLSAQLIDFGMGAGKGALMKGAFALGSAMQLGVAGRALFLSPAQRVLSTGLDRHTYLTTDGKTDIAGGLKRTVAKAVNPVNIATDLVTYAVAGGLATGLDKAVGDTLSNNRFFSTVTTGGIFGFTSQAGHELRAELATTGPREFAPHSTGWLQRRRHFRCMADASSADTPSGQFESPG